MAAQFQDVRLPQLHEQDQLVKLPDGTYLCRIVQMFDPDTESSAEPDDPDFIVEFERTAAPPEAWSEVPWFKL